MALTFNEFQAKSLARSARYFGMAVDSWTETDWACAAAGELGEACNLIKKLRRGEDVPAIEIAKELADAITYIDLLMYRLGFATGDIVAMKFNEVNARVSCPLMLSND